MMMEGEEAPAVICQTHQDLRGKLTMIENVQVNY